MIIMKVGATERQRWKKSPCENVVENETNTYCIYKIINKKQKKTK